ncbi:MAG TPA: MgtC/SapB family protein [Streptosporangiaceae bacterium]|jgi:putative Mg2+ transporter-C (MgtC) family protein
MDLALPPGQELKLLLLLLLALVLSAVIGFERELRQKSAGLRTHTLVGVGSALFMLVSKYGFGDVLRPEHVVLDPSRVAAQIVSGIGFIGAGVIFVRRDAVRGLTTAAVVWVTAAVGMACGAALPWLAIAVTIAHLAVVFGFTALSRHMPLSKHAPSELRLLYEDGSGALRRSLVACTDAGFVVTEVSVDRASPGGAGPADDQVLVQGDAPRQSRIVAVRLEVRGTGSVTDLAARLSDLSGMVQVTAGNPEFANE